MKNMMFDIVVTGIPALVFLLLYTKIKITSIKTIGTCNKIINATRGCQGMFGYQIDGIQYYNIERTSHIGWLKEGKKYKIYVKKNNYESFVSKKVIMDYLFFIILFGSLFLFFCYAEFIHG